MNRVFLLDALKVFTEESVKDILLPVRQQSDDDGPPEPRPPKVYRMRLKKESESTKAAPYIIHQLITSADRQPSGEQEQGRATVRSIFCVYHEDSEEGALALLGLMERQRIDLLRTVVLENQYQLDLESGLEMLIYPDGTAPYFAGEMICTWIMPGVRREVDLGGF